MGRIYICEKTGLKRGVWTPEEDLKLSDYITRYGHWNWRELPKYAGLSRCGKSCRLRWMNYLRPNIKRGNYTKEEEETIIRMHQQLGNRWSVIAASLPGRTDNEIKNYWHTHLKRRDSKLKNSMAAEPTPAKKCKTVKAINVKPLMILESSDILSVPTPTTGEFSLPSSNSDDLVSKDLNDEVTKSEPWIVQDSYSSESAVVDDTLFADITKSELSSDAEIFDLDFWNELFSVADTNVSSSSCSRMQLGMEESEISSGLQLQAYEFEGKYWSEQCFIEDTGMSNDNTAALDGPRFSFSYYALEDDLFL